MKRLSKVSLLVVLAVAITFGLVGLVRAATTTVNLGTADRFAILAGTEVTNVPDSAIIGDVGLSPAAGSNYAGLTATEVAGKIYDVDGTGPAGSVENPALLTSAKNDLTAAYLDAAGRTPFTTLPGDDNQLGNRTLFPGVYRFGGADNANLTGTLTLDPNGDPDPMWIFQATSNLVTASSSNIVLLGDATPCDVFWQVTSSATLGSDSIFKGTILALTSITLAARVNVEGKLLARNGNVTLIQDTITSTICAVPSTPMPYTGIAADEKGTPWNTAILAGIFTVSILFTALILFKVARRKKQTS